MSLNLRSNDVKSRVKNTTRQLNQKSLFGGEEKPKERKAREEPGKTLTRKWEPARCGLR